MILIPVVMAFIALDDIPGNEIIAAVVFVIAAGTDFLDGYLARKWEQTSTIGAFLDTVADKLLVTGALLSLVAVDRVWAWAAFIIIGREIAVMGLRSLAALGGDKVPPSFFGKSKATVQFVAITLAILRLGDPVLGLYIDEWAMLVAVAFTIGSGVEYFMRFRAVLAEQ
jgi:CDP-diacylglycerol--glycerol-3-phosphate 3-phosphatidyltransferase